MSKITCNGYNVSTRYKFA